MLPLQFFKKYNLHGYIYLIGLAGVITGLLFSKAVLSIAEIVIACNYLLEGQYSEKFKKLKENKTAIILVGLFFMHVFGLLYTSDFEYAYKDIRIKAPLLLFPIIFGSTSVLNGKQFQLFNLFFVLVVFVSTALIFAHFLLNRSEIIDMRDAFFNISHIRFSLIACMSLVVSIQYLLTATRMGKIILGLNCLWLIYFIIYFESMTGLIVASALAMVILIHSIRKNKLNLSVKYGILTAMTAAIAISGIFLFKTTSDYYILNEVKEQVDLDKTIAGRPYTHEYIGSDLKLRENGYQVYQNICYPEIQKEWNERSDVKLDYFNNIYIGTENVLLRYITSKGQPKDSVSISKLSEDEITAVENGIANVSFLNHSGMTTRIYKLLWEIDTYRSSGNSNGHSLAMRLEYWKTGLKIFGKNFWTGVGTGDIQNAFQAQYRADSSALDQVFRLRAHNQYITMAATFGIFGFLYFIVAFFYPIYLKKGDLLYLSFAVIMVISMISEDTLETQVGVTLYAFFNGLYFFHRTDEQ